tara:strand:+ start:232 stop:369 length:138 start_codon:yes stop_codon:yes gene_type:complete
MAAMARQKAALLLPLSLQDLTHSCHSPIDLFCHTLLIGYEKPKYG